MDRLQRIAEVIDLGHAPHPPALHAGNEIGDAGVAFPPALVRVLQAHDDLGEQRGLGRIGDIPDFMATAAEDAQHVGLAGVALGQRLAVADAHHLRAAFLVVAWEPGDMGEVFRLRRVGYVDDRGAVELGLAGQFVDGLRHVGGAAVVADIGDVAACPAFGWSAGRRCAPAGRCSRRAACSWLPADRRSWATARARAAPNRQVPRRLRQPSECAARRQN